MSESFFRYFMMSSVVVVVIDGVCGAGIEFALLKMLFFSSNYNNNWEIFF